jgi:phosphatidate phosphatase PAH1
MQRTLWYVIALPHLLLSCGGAPDSDPGNECILTEPTAMKGEWKNGVVTRFTLATGDADHSAEDVVVHPEEPFTLRGKFAYGPASKDLEQEEIVAFVRADGCSGWALVGDGTTDSDGRVSIPVDGLLSRFGRYDFRLIVRGDLSVAKGSIFVVEQGAPTVVFDIDGTLTTSDMELVDGAIVHFIGTAPERLFELAGPFDKEQYLLAANIVFDADADLQPGAVETVAYWRAQGHQIAYLTGRPYLFDHLTRDWLAGHGFPEGPLFLTQEILDGLPTAGGVQEFKREAIRRFEGELGLDVRYAYGNATTDICAYAMAGVDPERTYIIGRHAGEACDGYAAPNTVTDYPSHVAGLGSSAATASPLAAD